jgi:hypothetical protein
MKRGILLWLGFGCPAAIKAALDASSSSSYFSASGSSAGSTRRNRSFFD